MNRIMLRAAAVGTAMMLLAAGCKNDTPSAPINKETPVPVFTVITDLQTYLAGQSGGGSLDAPIQAKLSKADLSADDATELFAALADADKYVDLDLSGCTGLTKWEHYGAGADRVVSLVLPDSVTEIADGTSSVATFASFTSLKEITANKAETVGDWAFGGCAALKTISLPAAATIKASAFNSCSALASVSLPAAVTIGNYAFRNCAALKTANLPAATTIGANAFYYCTALASISLLSAATITFSAFDSCTALASVSLPVATNIGIGTFVGCTRLTDILVPSDNPNYTVKDGMLLDKAGTTLAAYPSAHGEITTLPETITAIGDYAFSLCAALASLSLPAATTIGGHAFEQCPLETVSLPAAVTLGGNAFGDCSVLETLSLPALTTIGDGAFTGCAALKTASLPKAAVIGTYAFASTAFETLSLPAAVTLGNSAFYNCRTLASANLPAVTAIGQSMFSNCYALESLTLGTALPTIIGTTSTVFGYAGRDSGGFTIYVPADGAKAALEAAIDDDSSAWHKALKTSDIRTGIFKEVAVKR